MKMKRRSGKRACYSSMQVRSFETKRSSEEEATTFMTCCGLTEKKNSWLVQSRLHNIIENIFWRLFFPLPTLVLISRHTHKLSVDGEQAGIIRKLFESFTKYLRFEAKKMLINLHEKLQYRAQRVINCLAHIRGLSPREDDKLISKTVFLTSFDTPESASSLSKHQHAEPFPQLSSQRQ